MRDSNVEVKLICNSCRTEFIVDLEPICAMGGRGFSLINRRGACKFLGCGGSRVLLYRLGKNLLFSSKRTINNIS